MLSVVWKSIFVYLRKSKNVHTSSKNILFHISYLKLTEYKFSSLLDELITADFNIFEVLDNGWVRMGRGAGCFFEQLPPQTPDRHLSLLKQFGKPLAWQPKHYQLHHIHSHDMYKYYFLLFLFHDSLVDDQ